MNAEDRLRYFKEQIAPRLQELDITGYVLVGYMKGDDGKIQRICLASDGGDAAISDGLRPVLHFSQMWGASPAEFAPKDPGDGEPKCE